MHAGHTSKACVVVRANVRVPPFASLVVFRFSCLFMCVYIHICIYIWGFTKIGDP